MMIKLFSVILIIVIIFIVKNFISVTIQTNRAINELKGLGKKYMNVESSKEDIQKWNKYIPILEGEYLARPKHMESLYFAIKDIFDKYLLYYYPDDSRLNFSNQEKEQAIKDNYKEILLIVLNDIQFILKKNAYREKEYSEIMSLFRKAISSNSKLYVTTSNNITLDELMILVNEIKNYVNKDTNEEIDWHNKINKLINKD